MKKKLAFVIQRYGVEINGGSELHCRQLVERLQDNFEITVLTNCATDYYSWKNDYKAGEIMVNGVKVIRFPVDFKRDKSSFDLLSQMAFANPENSDMGEEWMKQQGPYSSKLFEYIDNRQEDYDYFVFFTYLYANTYFGMGRVKNPEKIVLIPTAHDEPPIYLKIFDRVFRRPKAIIYNTETERNFIWRRFENREIANVVAGVGVEFPKDYRQNTADFKRRHGLDRYVLYIGRIDESKGCGEMFEYFLNYKSQNPSDLKLVLMGKEEMPIPESGDIVSLGFVSDAEKFDGIFGAKFMIVPSFYESLSISLLEAFLCKKAVLVNGSCEVLKNHCLSSGGGLWFSDEGQFYEAFDYLLKHEQDRKMLGANGYEYVSRLYTWDKIIKAVKRILPTEKMKSPCTE
ncbi:glycosyltransferase family 4 protein [Candidatus Peregrinibacteria bacterium]|nr:glycosyltransferase family 4 protein [Candidatus Peregrinibacteria bacterium]